MYRGWMLLQLFGGGGEQAGVNLIWREGGLLALSSCLLGCIAAGGVYGDGLKGCL